MLWRQKQTLRNRATIVHMVKDANELRCGHQNKTDLDIEERREETNVQNVCQLCIELFGAQHAMREFDSSYLSPNLTFNTPSQASKALASALVANALMPWLKN
jgi:hypothetical protein